MKGTHVDTRNLKYDDLRESYILEYQTNKRKSLRQDREGKQRLDAVVRLDHFFTGYKANEIDAELIRKFRAEEQAKGLSNGSINRSVSALRRMFNLAVEDGLLPSVPYFPTLDEGAPRKGFLERKQFEVFSVALPEYLRLPLALGYFTGMRHGEVLSRKWEHIDFLNGTILLWGDETKNSEPRPVPIVPQLRALLSAQLAKRRQDCPYVCFPLDRKSRAVRIKGFRKAWYRACIEVGLGKMEPEIDPASGEPVLAKPRSDRKRAKPKVKMIYRGLIFHDLRRSCVRNLMRAGVPEKVAMEISGHRTRNTFERYNITSERDLMVASRKLSVSLENGDNSGVICTEMQQPDLPMY